MKVVVDWDLCESNAICMGECPEVFLVDEEDVLHVNEEAATEARRAELEAAVRRCPRQALSLEE